MTRRARPAQQGSLLESLRTHDLPPLWDGHRVEWGGWPDGTNPRLCQACRLARDCPCHECECERQGTYHPTTRRRP